MIDELTGFERLAGTLGFPLFLLLVVLMVLWDRRRHRSGKRPTAGRPQGLQPKVFGSGATPAPVSQARPVDEPYKVFTRAFDLELDAERVPATLLDASLDRSNGWTDLRGGWQQVIVQAKSAAPPDTRAITELLSARFGSAPCPADELAITLLVDQSGSMRGQPIVATVKAIEAIADTLGGFGILTEILGFSTAGWHGGYARQQWRKQGFPPRPGRLCALLHIIYKAGDAPIWSEASRRVMLHPDVLRENVDGEALDWAWSRLRSGPSKRKLLIMISDGAPVDDSTLAENTPDYLERHLMQTIAQIEEDSTVTLGAIGIDHDVQRYYRVSRSTGLDAIVDRFGELLDELLAVSAPAAA